MVSLKLQKRLAAAILHCGRRKLWLDPGEVDHVAMANSRKEIRNLIKDGMVLRRPTKLHARFRARRALEAKRNGRHTGHGKRSGTKEARLPTKVLWMRRMRVLRRLIRKYRELKKIDKHVYHEAYMKVKGNVFRHKRGLMENIHRLEADKRRDKALIYQLEAIRIQSKDNFQRMKVSHRREECAPQLRLLA
ncbi:60S ribosomal protein L19-3-like [Zingiber officinale]|uniref:Large ribosomal subunit protein eL19 domain-containing protein n=1 Tax=Zingiber officinale TaxID=94328 RepID=A0A8J5KME5_ZINOF|nr:60S ribosomal protein L19-3-like [Zingiber officinale]KAG6482448.1 hypothetical protein ZIOFF_059079 [Zingiber officinale]